MILTYLILNIAFMTVALLIYRRWLPPVNRGLLITAATVIALTAMFDSLIIHFDIVAYDTTKLLGLYIGKAPIEDFAYAILAILIAPTLWKYFETRIDS